MLTDFQNYFTTEKGIKFTSNPVIFHHILNMFLHYLGEVKSSNLLRSAADKLKNRITFDKNETLKLPRSWKDTVRLAHYNICSKCPPFAATQERRRRRHCLSALSITRWSGRSHSSTMGCRNSQFLTSLFAKNIKHATYFKIANQQQQQNPVNELSCTNLCALVCFLRTNICGSFFMVHGV